MIKNLQQRLNDIKKTLQKELKYQNVHLPNENVETKPSNLHKTPSSQSLTTKPAYTSYNSQQQVRAPNHPNSIPFLNSPNSPPPVNNSHLSSLHDDVNFKYLKHVVLKFLCSREYEVSILFICLFGKHEAKLFMPKRTLATCFCFN